MELTVNKIKIVRYKDKIIIMAKSNKAIFLFASFLMLSCNHNYQQLSTEFIRNLPDSCEFLVQLDNESEHTVYYKSKKHPQLYCYDVETEETENIILPKVDEYLGTPQEIGAGKENIIIVYMDEESLSQSFSDDTHVGVQIYSLETRSFKEFTTCNGYVFNEGKKQLACTTFFVDKYGDGTCTDETFDFDGKLLSSKEFEVADYVEVPTGTLAAREKEREAAEEQQAQSTNFYTQSRPTTRYYCELCGYESKSTQELLSNHCLRNRERPGYHKLYEGGEKEWYSCRYCGKQFKSIKEMTWNGCLRREMGMRHAPAL